jgi:hypothetical protein
MQFETLIDMGYSALFTGVFLTVVLPHQEITECYFCVNRSYLILGGILLAIWLTHKK